MSELQEGLSIILDKLQHDDRFLATRIEAAVDVMESMPYYEHMKILKAIFHIPIKEEVEDYGS